MATVEIQNLTKRYGDFLAVDDVSISVPAGEVCTLLGPSGCGKTTTLRCVAGLETADVGRIIVDGVTVSDAETGTFVPPERRGLGMVFQSYALWPHKSVFENLALGLRISGRGRGEVADKVAEVLAVVGMEGAENRFPAQLSGGQQQRIAVARALALEPKCLLFDEPLSNLDVLLRDRMRFEIRDLLTKQGITALYVTHDQTEAMVISDTVCVMNKGRVAGQGSPAELYDQPSSRFVAEFFGRTNLLPLDRAASRPDAGIVVTTGGLALASRDAPRLVDTSGELTIAVRPESIRIVEAPDERSFDACVHACAHLGPNTDVEIEVKGHRLSVLVAGRLHLKAGARVGACVSADDVMIISGD